MVSRLLCLTVSLGLTWAFGDVLNLSTGIDTTGPGCDVHWTVSATPTSDVPFVTACPGNAAQVVTSTDPDFFHDWVANTPDSSWIARIAGIIENGDNNYSVNFWLDSASGDMLSGVAAVDNV